MDATPHLIKENQRYNTAYFSIFEKISELGFDPKHKRVESLIKRVSKEYASGNLGENTNHEQDHDLNKIRSNLASYICFQGGGLSFNKDRERKTIDYLISDL